MLLPRIQNKYKSEENLLDSDQPLPSRMNRLNQAKAGKLNRVRYNFLA